MHADTLRTQHRTLFKATVGDADWSVRAVLSLPIVDLAGDIVRPDGIDFAPHMADPWVDLEHGFEPGVGRQPVGWARKSLARAGEPYAVEHALLTVPGSGQHRLPVGTSYFDRDHPLQRQTFLLIQKGALPGVSLEFRPVQGYAKSLGPSPLERRDAYDFGKIEVVRWTHCVEPVCPGALTVLKSLPPELDALAKALRDGKVEGEDLHPAIVKSLARYKPTVTLVSVGKAMDATATPSTVYDAAAPEITGAADDTGPANNGVSALYAHAQALSDACDQLEADLENTDSPELYRAGLKLCEEARSLAEKFKAAGDKHDAKLQAIKGGKAEPTEDDTDDPDMDTDDDGTFKAVRPCYKPILKAVRGVKRYSLSEVQKGIDDARAAAIESSRVETTAEALARLEKEDPAAYAALEAKARRNRRLRTA